MRLFFLKIVYFRFSIAYLRYWIYDFVQEYRDIGMYE